MGQAGDGNRSNGPAGGGLFITLEGIEGAGKTSRLDGIVAFLNDRGIACATTREPGGTPIGAQARRLVDNDVIQLAGVKMGFFVS